MATTLPETVFVPPAKPAGVIRATTSAQMYTISPNTFQHDMLYLIGEQQSVFSKTYTFTNITTNADLAITIDVPVYVKSSVSTITVKPKQQIVIDIQLDGEAATKYFIAHKQSTVVDTIAWTVKPVNFSGPVYIPAIDSPTTMVNASNQTAPAAPVAKITFNPPNLTPAPAPLPQRISWTAL
jgi:hypothetical protein